MSVGVPAHVGERLLAHAVEGQLGFTRQAPVDPADGYGGVEGTALVKLVHAPLEGGAEAEVVENRGAEIEGDAADVLQRLGRQLAQFLHALLGVLGVAGALEQAQADQQRSERLGGLVVQLTRQAASAPPPGPGGSCGRSAASAAGSVRAAEII